MCMICGNKPANATYCGDVIRERSIDGLDTLHGLAGRVLTVLRNEPDSTRLIRLTVRSVGVVCLSQYSGPYWWGFVHDGDDRTRGVCFRVTDSDTAMHAILVLCKRTRRMLRQRAALTQAA